MTPLDWLLIAFCLTATFLHIITSLLAMRRCRQRTVPLPAPERAPLVSILRPVRGLDRCEEVTLASIDYPNFELIFCCADADDPAVALIRSLIARNPGVRSRLLIGNHE
ncbi:MAG TPA: ceramide glucosyltransferase, partial [Hyphomicrobiaceae bacterium]|nr:ceramide glucosyltransferase [Hyphomicrobiaceae bacterium]